MNVKDTILKKYFNVLFLVMICTSCIILAEPTVDVFQLTEDNLNESDDNGRVTIVVDPGHGGRDPGKVGVNDVLEKDINLSIALKLKEFLELNDINVVMTRETDIGLYAESDSNKKVSDMKKRVALINRRNVVLAVSIHQNSFIQESSKGAQVFYYSNSKEGKDFAQIMQNQLKISLKDGNKREAKFNDSYYMLKKTECPIVIVECGYLSNYTEAALLVDDNYQEELAWAIHLGILSYLNQNREEITSTKSE